MEQLRQPDRAGGGWAGCNHNTPPVSPALGLEWVWQQEWSQSAASLMFEGSVPSHVQLESGTCAICAGLFAQGGCRDLPHPEPLCSKSEGNSRHVSMSRKTPPDDFLLRKFLLGGAACWVCVLLLQSVPAESGEEQGQNHSFLPG